MKTEKLYIQLNDGQRFYPKLPQPENFTLNNMAQGLSQTCRFAGQCLYYYSVAEHSILVSNLVPKRFARQALLHDAAEAFVHDIATPLKRDLPAYKPIEKKIMDMIFQRYNVWPTDESIAAVKQADWNAFVAETQVLLKIPTDANIGDSIPTKVALYCWPPHTARTMFIARFIELFTKAEVDAGVGIEPTSASL